METHKLNIRQGDISLHYVNIIPNEFERVSHDGSFILAIGEQTNHKHIIKTQDPNDLEILKTKDSGYFFNLKREGIITHEEHKTLRVQPGTYEMKREREFDWFSMAIRKVID